MGQARLDGLCLMYIHNDISISTGVIIKKIAAKSRKTLISCYVFMLQLLQAIPNIFR